MNVWGKTNWIGKLSCVDTSADLQIKIKFSVCCNIMYKLGSPQVPKFGRLLVNIESSAFGQDKFWYHYHGIDAEESILIKNLPNLILGAP